LQASPAPASGASVAARAPDLFSTSLRHRTIFFTVIATHHYTQAGLPRTFARKSPFDCGNDGICVKKYEIVECDGLEAWRGVFLRETRSTRYNHAKKDEKSSGSSKPCHCFSLLIVSICTTSGLGFPLPAQQLVYATPPF
jgi:hypothetical protein